MKSETFGFKDETGLEVFVYKWLPDGAVKGAVQIAHGMAETAARYERLAEQLTGAGFAVYANDHCGHGKTVGDPEKVGDLGEDGSNHMLDNMKQLLGIIKKENPGLPVFLLGHSMGSFLTQRFLQLYGETLNGAVLSGSNGKVPGIMLWLGRLISGWEIRRRGRGWRSELLNKLSFGAYNKPFRPNRTPFDWLSRDDDEVDKYIANPYCGGVFTAGFFHDLGGLLKLNGNKKEVAKVPKDLPIYIFSGDMDPVGEYGKGVMRLVKAYQKAGVKNLQYKLYKGGRHEMLNETNRDEVMKDIIDWLHALCL